MWHSVAWVGLVIVVTWLRIGLQQSRIVTHSSLFIAGSSDSERQMCIKVCGQQSIEWLVQFSLSIEQTNVWSLVSKKHSEAYLMVQKFISLGMTKMIIM